MKPWAFIITFWIANIMLIAYLSMFNIFVHYIVGYSFLALSTSDFHIKRERETSSHFLPVKITETKSIAAIPKAFNLPSWSTLRPIPNTSGKHSTRTSSILHNQINHISSPSKSLPNKACHYWQISLLTCWEFDALHLFRSVNIYFEFRCNSCMFAFRFISMIFKIMIIFKLEMKLRENIRKQKIGQVAPLFEILRMGRHYWSHVIPLLWRHEDEKNLP